MNQQSSMGSHVFVCLRLCVQVKTWVRELKKMLGNDIVIAICGEAIIQFRWTKQLCVRMCMCMCMCMCEWVGGCMRVATATHLKPLFEVALRGLEDEVVDANKRVLLGAKSRVRWRRHARYGVLGLRVFVATVGVCECMSARVSECVSE